MNTDCLRGWGKGEKNAVQPGASLHFAAARLIDVTRESLWPSACVCTYVSGWLVGTGVNTVGGAALEAFLSSLKHNLTYIWRPGEESVERGYVAIGDGKAYFNI